MQTVIIVIHLLVVIALVGVVLVQRSEGGGLGVGGGSGFMTARGTKNALTRMTAILAGCFFLTSIILTVFQAIPAGNGSGILDRISGQGQEKSVGSKTDVPDQAGSPAAHQEGDKAAVPVDGHAAPLPLPSQSDVPN